jgi:hypothetical protein
MDLASRILRKSGKLMRMPVNPHLYRRGILQYQPQKIIFLKQYGERRTGTNFLRAVLLDNYPTAYPLMHVLGDKHSPPVDLAAELEKTRNLPKAEMEFVTRATLATPAKTTLAEHSEQPEHSEQQLYLQKLAQPLTTAVRENRLGFIISTKHPYPWAASIARFKKWTKEDDGRCQMNPEFAERLEEACRISNQNHQAWLDLYERNKTRSAIIRHEDLMVQPLEVVSRVEKKFGLWRFPVQMRLPQKKVEPTFWDQHAPWLDEKTFNPALYTSRLYEEQLNDELWSIVTKTIDWKLMARFGYDKSCV